MLRWVLGFVWVGAVVLGTAQEARAGERVPSLVECRERFIAFAANRNRTAAPLSMEDANGLRSFFVEGHADRALLEELGKRGITHPSQVRNAVDKFHSTFSADERASIIEGTVARLVAEFDSARRTRTPRLGPTSLSALQTHLKSDGLAIRQNLYERMGTPDVPGERLANQAGMWNRLVEGATAGSPSRFEAPRPGFGDTSPVQLARDHSLFEKGRVEEFVRASSADAVDAFVQDHLARFTASEIETVLKSAKLPAATTAVALKRHQALRALGETVKSMETAEKEQEKLLAERSNLADALDARLSLDAAAPVAPASPTKMSAEDLNARLETLQRRVVSRVGSNGSKEDRWHTAFNYGWYPSEETVLEIRTFLDGIGRETHVDSQQFTRIEGLLFNMAHAMLYNGTAHKYFNRMDRYILPKRQVLELYESLHQASLRTELTEADALYLARHLTKAAEKDPDPDKVNWAKPLETFGNRRWGKEKEPMTSVALQMAKPPSAERLKQKQAEVEQQLATLATELAGHRAKKAEAVTALEHAALPGVDVARAQTLLRRTLDAEEKKALENAHQVGRGEKGKDGEGPASLGNYRQAHIAQKNRILKEAGFTPQEIRVLMEAGVVGNGASGSNKRYEPDWNSEAARQQRDAERYWASPSPSLSEWAAENARQQAWNEENQKRRERDEKERREGLEAAERLHRQKLAIPQAAARGDVDAFVSGLADHLQRGFHKREAINVQEEMHTLVYKTGLSYNALYEKLFDQPGWDFGPSFTHLRWAEQSIPHGVPREEEALILWDLARRASQASNPEGSQWIVSDVLSPRVNLLSTYLEKYPEMAAAVRRVHAKWRLQRPLDEEEVQAIETAHRVGRGEPGSDGRQTASAENDRQVNRTRKIRILQEAGFREEEILLMMDTGIVRNAPLP